MFLLCAAQVDLSVDFPPLPHQIDPNPLNAVAAGVLHMSAGGKVGCLLRLEPNKDAKVGLLTLFGEK